ncbi:CheB methylesterase [Gulbenkiania indica]|uniref:protein-glutamate methylesterase n=1 Tax=Gulbenkiania indica TaxID=375574 RepID=A0A0K6GTK6_9NEIS|nr:chemotaxis protein CheB [Gulbenkiania indica]CUA81893.1 CheB methylesterase [Gulbenkiania indica]
MTTAAPTSAPRPARRFAVVVIGASAGGIEALGTVLPMLPKHYTLPVVVVLHLPADEPSLLAEVFSYKVGLATKEADEKERLQPGVIYFAPPSYHLLLEADGTFALSTEEPVHFSRPSIDVLFESAADAYGERAVGVLLTGASQDGARGLLAIREAGGQTLAQDPAEAMISIMPAAAVELGAARAVLPLKDIGRFLAGLEKEA